jgi:hypothetical protein
MPKKKQKKLRPRNGQKQQFASSMPMQIAPKNVSMRRKILYGVDLTGTGGGLLTQSIDLAAVLAASSAWTNAVTVFERAQVPRIVVQLASYYMYNTSSPALVGMGVLYYDSASSAVVSTIEAGLNHNEALLIDGGLPLISAGMSIHTALGIKTPVASQDYVAGFLGYLNCYGLNYRPASAAFRLIITFDVTFSYSQ